MVSSAWRCTPAVPGTARPPSGGSSPGRDAASRCGRSERVGSRALRHSCTHGPALLGHTASSWSTSSCSPPCTAPQLLRPSPRRGTGRTPRTSAHPAHLGMISGSRKQPAARSRLRPRGRRQHGLPAPSHLRVSDPDLTTTRIPLKSDMVTTSPLDSAEDHHTPLVASRPGTRPYQRRRGASKTGECRGGTSEWGTSASGR